MAAPKKILYFIAGTCPTEAEWAAANKFGTQMFRSVEGFSDSDYIEICDGVAGLAPDIYTKRFSRVDVPAPVEVVPPSTPEVPTVPEVPATDANTQPSPPWKK